MKQRLLSAAVGLGIFFVVLAFFHTIVLNISIAAVIVLAIYELLDVSGIKKHRLLTGVCLVFGAAGPFITDLPDGQIKMYATAIFALILFCIMIFDHEKTPYTAVATAFGVTCSVTFSLGTLIAIRGLNENWIYGLYYVLVGFGFAWLTDTGAFLVGITCGKHPLAPKISPKKTVEGAVGGVLFCVATVFLFSLVFTWICAAFWGETVQVNYWRLLALAPFASLISMLGDLCASVIKRQCGVKDFGSILPGHGGMMDRFDSVLFVFPLLYLVVRVLPLV